MLAWLAVRFLLLRAGATPRRVDTLWTLNPLVFGIGVLGAHVDLVAAALGGGRAGAGRPQPAGRRCVRRAWRSRARSPTASSGWPSCWRGGCTSGAGSCAARCRSRWPPSAVVVPLHLWAGPHVFDQLDRARRSISLATPWRLLYEALTGPLTSGHARTLVTWLAVALVLVLVVVLARLTRGTRADDLDRRGGAVGAGAQHGLHGRGALLAAVVRPAHLGDPARPGRERARRDPRCCDWPRWPSPTCRAGWSA